MFLREKLSRRRALGIVLSIVGVGLVVLAGEVDRGSPRPVLGALWMIGAVIAWAAYTIFAKRLADADQVITIALVSLFGMLTIALRELDASLVGALTNLDPTVGGITAVIFLGETLHGGQVAGGAIALAGMWLASTEPPAADAN